ncbi:hypothetical protein Dsin_016655 [Dipteronia sinensis]|uniref:CCHC-type domain-containing protein n=1 Tax=Dipteronia sinensis TaxID=43782 RepID=A0AAE0ADS7_9ROSI|nr:hypothetical protein Dsin_016655 [Dipteronia sinensis]
MDPGGIARLCASLSLIEQEGPVRKLKENLRTAALKRMSTSLVGKILASKTVNRGACIRVIGRIWKVRHALEIESVTGNIFAFHFEDEVELQRILGGGPWSFDDALMVLERPAGRGTIDMMSFRHADFWVQIRQVPLICMTREIGCFLGGLIGVVVRVDGGDSGECVGKFMRIRVRIDITKPLRRCLRVDVLGDRAETVMLLRYERLPNHCFKCGRVGHITGECTVGDPIPVVNGMEKPTFGSWLRASSPFHKPFFQHSNGFHDMAWKHDSRPTVRVVQSLRKVCQSPVPEWDVSALGGDVGIEIKDLDSIVEVVAMMDFAPNPGILDLLKDSVCIGQENVSVDTQMAVGRGGPSPVISDRGLDGPITGDGDVAGCSYQPNQPLPDGKCYGPGPVLVELKEVSGFSNGNGISGGPDLVDLAQEEATQIHGSDLNVRTQTQAGSGLTLHPKPGKRSSSRYPGPHQCGGHQSIIDVPSGKLGRRENDLEQASYQKFQKSESSLSGQLLGTVVCGAANDYIDSLPVCVATNAGDGDFETAQDVTDLKVSSAAADNSTMEFSADQSLPVRRSQ